MYVDFMDLGIIPIYERQTQTLVFAMETCGMYSHWFSPQLAKQHRRMYLKARKIISGPYGGLSLHRF